MPAPMMPCSMQVISEGALHAPGHTEALLQELFIAGQESPAGYATGLSADLTAALAAGRASFPMASLLQSHSSERLSPLISVQREVLFI